jgi:SAM-dependent methyltransferase
VLDIACGTGFLSLIEARLGHRVTGIDLSQAMLAEARASAERAGVAPRFQVGDAVSPPFPSAGFDAITNRHFLWTMLEPETGFRNWHDLLRPGGRVVSIDGFWFRDSPDDEASQMEEPGLFERHYTKATKAELPIMRLAEPRPIVDMFRRAGFADVRLSDLSDVHAVAKDPPGEDPWYVITAVRP